MGNHEFCSRCHASDFHSGMTCEQAYPEKLARTNKERKRHEQDRLKARVEIEKIVAVLRRKNIPAELEESMGLDKIMSFATVVVHGHNLVGNRREAMHWTNPNRRRTSDYDNY